MNRFLCLAMLVLSCACASPGPDMFGADKFRVTLGGIDFVVYRKGDQAQVIRMTALAPGSHGGVQSLMEQAAAQATGCRVVPGSITTKIPGDTGVANLDLIC
ncbi:hypothetical protein [Paracoccus sp. (in: a-proteobacteria)]|uniref:hypothetical protein n=1 Tax=Paracoccus sp. TaxID=267 RepID=UPI003A8C7108